MAVNHMNQDVPTRRQVSEAHERVSFLEAAEWRPIEWSAVFTGLLAVIGAAMLFGLLGAAIGAHQLAPREPANFRVIGFGALVFAVFSVFFSYVLGGWAAGRVVGGHPKITQAHGLLTWLLSIPAIMLLMAVGAGPAIGGLASGFPTASAIAADDMNQGARTPAQQRAARSPQAAQVQEMGRRATITVSGEDPEVNPEEAAGKAARNGALAAFFLALLGLAGGATGGRMAGGKPPAFAREYLRTA